MKPYCHIVLFVPSKYVCTKFNNIGVIVNWVEVETCNNGNAFSVYV